MRILRSSVLAVFLATPAYAQSIDSESLPEAEDAIVVTADRFRGSVDSAQPPVAVIDEEEIASYGASSLEELLQEIAPQATSGRGRGSGGHPAILLNGQRISGFRELRNYPPEAIRRVEVLPEEVAQRFGFSPDQRVVNFILKDNFMSTTVEADYGWPGSGGYSTNEFEVSVVRIDGARRLNLAIEADDSSPLTEAERGVSSSGTVPFTGDADPAAYRTLIADSRDLKFTGNWSTGFGEGGLDGSLAISAVATRSDSERLSGLDAVTLSDDSGESVYRTLLAPAQGFDARRRKTRSTGFELGATLQKPLGNWQLTATGSWAHDESRTLTDASADTSALESAALAGMIALDAPSDALLASGLVTDGVTDRARSNSETASSLLTLAGTPLRLPAGDVSLTVKGGFDWDNIQSSDTRNPGTLTDLTRGDASAGFTLGLPITSRKTGVLDAIGTVSLNFSGGVNHVSDFGTLYNWSAGVSWDITRALNLQVSHIYAEQAPGLSELGAPETVTLDSTVYDFVTGQTVLVDIISGGNPNLQAEKQRDWKVALNWDLPILDRSRFIAEYFDETSRNVTAGFPLLTPAIEAAFPDRVLRDASGGLVQIDERPITFDREKSRRLRYGIDVSDRIADNSAAGGGEARGGRGGGGPGFGPGNRRGGRWSLALYHTVRFDETVRVGVDGPVLDLLHGDSLSATPKARHELELRGGLYYNGFGLRLSGEYLGGSKVDGSGAPGSSSLRFRPIATFDMRLFVDFGQQKSLVEKVGFLKNSRMAFRVDNIFNAQQRVVDDNGVVPLSYSPAFLDPAGRFFEIDFRKMF
ncbi:MAG: TonB-dependent receptor [Caenibius sp.]